MFLNVTHFLHSVTVEVSAPVVQTVVSKAAISMSPAQPQTSVPITVQACPQVKLFFFLFRSKLSLPVSP